MTRKERLEYLKWKRELGGQHLCMRQELLELLGKVRTFTFRADQGRDPMSLALQSLQRAIDDFAEALTGRRDHLWAKHHCIGGSKS
jgi:hypothetical protein